MEGTIIDASCNSILDLHTGAWAVPFSSITVARECTSQIGKVSIGNEPCISQCEWVSENKKKKGDKNVEMLQCDDFFKMV